MGLRQEALHTARWVAAGITFFLVISAGPVLARAGGAPTSVSPADGIGSHHLRSAPGKLAFAFGRQGGDAPLISVTISDTGAVRGREAGSVKNFRLQPAATMGLLKLAEAVGFFRADRTTCSPHDGIAQGDISTSYITVWTTRGIREVASPGTCNSGFFQFLDVLWAVARL